MNEFKSKMDTTVSELQTQLAQNQAKVTRLHDENKRLRDQLTERESKIIQVSMGELPGESPLEYYSVCSSEDIILKRCFCMNQFVCDLKTG